MKVYARFATEKNTTSDGRVIFDAAKRSITKGKIVNTVDTGVVVVVVVMVAVVLIITCLFY